MLPLQCKFGCTIFFFLDRVRGSFPLFVWLFKYLWAYLITAFWVSTPHPNTPLHHSPSFLCVPLPNHLHSGAVAMYHHRLITTSDNPSQPHVHNLQAAIVNYLSNVHTEKTKYMTERKGNSSRYRLHERSPLGNTE